MEEQLGKIYYLKDPITLEIKYIGKTRKDLNYRLELHFRHRNQKKNKGAKSAAWIKELWEQHGLKPEIHLIEELKCDDVDLFYRENYYTKLYVERGYNLTNMLNNPKYVYPKNVNGKKIFCYDRDYNLTTFVNARQADSILSINYKKISQSIIEEKAMYNYVFSYVELSMEEILLRFSRFRMRKMIIGTNRDTSIKTKYNTQQEAATTLGVNFRNINQCLKGIRASCGNHTWEYDEELI